MNPGQLSLQSEPPPPPPPPPDWLRAARRALWDECKLSRAFTSDDVWRRLGTINGEPADPRAMGAVMKHGKRRAWCEPTPETVGSTRGTNHGRSVRVWRSLVRP